MLPDVGGWRAGAVMPQVVSKLSAAPALAWPVATGVTIGDSSQSDVLLANSAATQVVALGGSSAALRAEWLAQHDAVSGVRQQHPQTHQRLPGPVRRHVRRSGTP